MNMQLLQFIIMLGTQIAVTENPDTRSLAYLQLLTGLMRSGTMSGTTMAALKARYEQEVADNVPVTAEYLSALDARVNLQSAQIQATGEPS